MEKSFCADPFRAHLDALSGAVNLLVDGVSGGVRYFGDTPEMRRKLVAHLAAQLVKVYGIIDSTRQRYEAVIGSETVDYRKDVRKQLQTLKTRVDNDTDAEMKPYAARVLWCIERANDVLRLGPLCQDEPIPAGSRVWSDDEIRVAIDLLKEGKSRAYIATVLHRSVKSVQNKILRIRSAARQNARRQLNAMPVPYPFEGWKKSCKTFENH